MFRHAWFALLPVVLLLAGCHTPRPDDPRYFQMGESVVLAGEQPARLAFLPEPPWPVVVRSTYLRGLPLTVVYQPGRDFQADSDGYIWRTPQSRIPDFRTNLLFGREDFRHDQFPGFGNGPFFVYVDYTHRGRFKPKPAKAEFSAATLPQTQQKLRAGEPLRIVAFGDSITAGGDASTPKLIFWERWADALRQKYPRANIEAINGATGGDTTVQGLTRLSEKVIAQKPNLVLIGFGMNDHNREGHGVPLPAFSENLRKLVDRVRAESGAEVVLFSAFPPNPKWHFGSHNMAAYAEATQAVAREKRCAFADVFQLWQKLSQHKKPEDLLANNINHPNDYGHWIYFQALQMLGL
jgi:lysophospholipase L1-like esterase